MRLLSAAAVLVFTPAVALADAPRARAGAPAAIVATPLPPSATAMQIDGELTEDIWKKVPAVSGFVQRDPKEGAPATFDTEVRVAFDDTALYIAVNAIDPDPSKVVGILTRRDEGSPSDWVRVLIDSYRDRRTAYEFAVNAAGVKQDTYWFNDGNTDSGWDAVWEVAVSRHDRGWRAEFRIPFSQLRFNPSASQTFGFAVMRQSPRINETTTWPRLSRSASGFVSQFGDLSGLSFARSPRRLELMPYAVGQVTTKPVVEGNPLRSTAEPGAAIGLDLKYALAPGLTLTGTINPDFGQVEADPAVVNLSGFETFFAERRPFFVEGSGNFSFNIDCNDGQCTGLFYSRRIGRAPQRFVSAPQDGFAAAPDNTTILGAAKITGRVGRFSIGVMNAVTSREHATLAMPRADGDIGFDRAETPVEPATNYFIARASREFPNQSRLAFMVTSTNRGLSDELSFLPSSAVTGGVDTDIRFGRRFSLQGMWAGSLVRGDAPAISRIQRSTVHSYQRPDAAHIELDPARTSLAGQAGSISFGKIAGQRYRFNTYAGFKSPGFDINDLGFQSRADEIMISNWHQLTWDKPGRYVRRRNVNFNQWAGWNFDGDLRFTGGNINSHWTFTNNWTVGSGINFNGRGFADRLTRGGPGGYTNAAWSQWGYVDSDNRKPVMANFSGSWFNDMKGSWNRSTSLGLTYRPASNISARVGVDLSRNHAESQWVANFAETDRTRYVFGVLDQTTAGLSARVNYTITPQLTVQLFARPFVSAGDYEHFKELVDGRAKDYAARYAPYAYEGSPDFNIRSFRTTNVLRWEYRPGSVLFVVWQQGRDGFANDGRFRLGRSFGDIFESDAQNVFLIKFSRWLNF